MISFELQASVGCVAHASLAVALAAEFGEVDHEEADAAFDALAAPIVAERVDPEDPAECLDVLAEHVTPELFVRAERTKIDDLLLDAVLNRRSGHPLALAILCAEAGRRAGLPLGVACGAGSAWVVHRAEGPLVLDPRDGGSLVGARSVGGELRWRCSHQTAERLLCGIAGRAHRTGHVGWALRAAELRLALPVAEHRRAVLEDERARIHARLN